MLRRQSELSLQTLASVAEADRLRIALSAAGGVVYDWTPDTGEVSWAGDVQGVLGISDPSAVSSEALFRKHLDPQGLQARANLAEAIHAPGALHCAEFKFNAAAQAPRWLEDRAVVFTRPNGQVERVVGTLRDITARKTADAQVLQSAHIDEMTGHLTRGRLRDRLNEMVAQGPTAYCVVAIDDLAVLNEVYGTDAADVAIVAVGRKLAETAGAHAAIGRTAGNKFGMAVPGADALALQTLSQEIRNAVRDMVITTPCGVVSVSVSVGAVLAPCDADTAQKAMARAEVALDRAKAQGRGGYALYEHAEQAESTRLRVVSLGDQILSALADDRVRIAYQPIVDPKTGKAEAQECLARILKPDGQLLPAGEFIPAAEQLGLVRLIDRRILEIALDTLRRNADVRLALNVSGMTASDRLALEGFATTLEMNRDVAPRLIVELTETAALLDLEESVRFTARLRDIGAKVAIDDFGAGYTSFRNLQALRVDMVKIDGSFVKGLALSPDNLVFVRTLVDLARNFRLQTVAEWVSDQREADILCAMGVDFLQGFYLGKPDIAPEWLR